MVGCLSEEVLAALLSGAASDNERDQALHHVGQCQECLALLGTVAAGERSAPPRPESGADFTPPEQLDEYRLTRPIGRGAMGQVYLGHDTRLDRAVAIKFLLDVQADSTARERFLVEARAIARLSHPNVVTIHRVGELKGRSYLVSEFIRGKSLAEMEKPVSSAQALTIGRGLARGLAAAHRGGVVHRDIKPANVMLAEDGTVKLLDFGLAKLLAATAASGTRSGLRFPSAASDPELAELAIAATMEAPKPVPFQAESASLTHPGTLVGTPIYMAPELWRGEAATCRSDIYALGALLFELCSGRTIYPNAKTLQDLAKAVEHSDAPPLRLVVPNIEPELAAVVDRCLRRDPAERFASGEVLCAALEPLGAGPNVTGPLPTAHEVAVDQKQLVFGEARSTPRIGKRLATVLLPYAGVSFIALQGVDWAVNRYVLSSRLVDLCGYLIFLLLPTALLLGGLPGGGLRGRRRWVKPLGIAANMMLAAVILTLGFRGKDLGSATRRVQVQSEDGTTAQREVAKSEFIKRVAIFFFDNDTGDKDLNWLQFAIQNLIELDLFQDSFLRTAGGSEFSQQLKKAGLDEYSREPLGLKQAIARDMHLDYFLSGSFTKERDDYVIRYAVYRTQRGQRMTSHTTRGPDLLSLIDEISVQLKRDLDVPTHHIETVTDLPVSEISSSSMSALRDYEQGVSAGFFHHDRQTAKQLFAQAVAKDPSFALAYYVSYEVYAAGLEMGPAKEALRLAKQNEYRLCERQRFDLNWTLLLYAQAPDGQAAVLQQWTTLYPADTEAWRSLLEYYVNQGRTNDAIGVCKKLLLLDPENDQYLLALGQLYQEAGNTAQGLSTFTDFATHYPSDARGPARIADLYGDIGEHEKARSFYQKVLAIDPDSPVGLVGECGVDLRLGNLEPACLQRALSRSPTAAARAKVYRMLEVYYGYRGMWRKALETIQLGATEQQNDFGRPAKIALLRSIAGHLHLGQTGEAQALLTAAESSYKPADGPWIAGIRSWRIYYYIHTGDARSAASLLKETDALISSYGIGRSRRLLKYFEGQLHELTGEYQLALQVYAQLPRVNSNWNGDWNAAELLAKIGSCQRQLGQVKEAESSLKEGLVLEPSQPVLHYELALVYQQAGRLPEAREQVQAALRVWSDADPEFDTARKARELAASLGTAQ